MKQIYQQKILKRLENPKPLPLILSIAMGQWALSWQGSKLAKTKLPFLNPYLNPNLPFETYQEVFNQIEKTQFEKLKSFTKGLNNYWHHPFYRVEKEYPIFDQKLTTKIFNYGLKEGKPIFIIPSLINSSYVLDLFEEVSFFHYLKKEGFQPFLVNWGSPSKVQWNDKIEDYVLKILLPALQKIINETGQKPIIVGYCMGGILGLILAQFWPELIDKLVLLGTPFNFKNSPLAYPDELLEAWLSNLQNSNEIIPAYAIPYVFIIKDPFLIINKFCFFEKAPQLPFEESKLFVAVEDWVNDSIPLSKGVGIQVIEEWFLKNQLKEEKWSFYQEKFDPKKIKAPTLLVVPHKDRVIPPNAAIDLKDFLPNVTLMKPNLGHVGMIASHKAHDIFWPNLLKWINS